MESNIITVILITMALITILSLFTAAYIINRYKTNGASETNSQDELLSKYMNIQSQPSGKHKLDSIVEWQKSVSIYTSKNK